MDATPVSTELTTAWQLALEGWTDGRRHDTVLGVAAKYKEFAWLATRYREFAKANPGDAIAPARLPRVQRAAAIVMMAKIPPATEPMPKMFKMAAVMLVGSVVAIVVGLFVADSKVQQHQDPATVSRHP